MQIFSVVEAGESDQSEIYQLYKSLFKTHVEKIWGWNEEWQANNFRKEWNEFETQKIILDDELIGYFQIADRSDHYFLLNFGLISNFQGKGIGSQILKTLKQRAEASSKEIRLSVFDTNKRAIPFYLRNGFTMNEKTETGETLSWRLH